MEDSISCSPGNSGKKSRSRRFHKNPRKKLAQSITKHIDENVLPKEQSYLEALYEESTLSETLNTTSQFQYFNPFENEKLLAAADRAEASTSRSRMQNLTSKGFVCLESKQFEEDNKISYMQPPQCSTRLQRVVTPKSPHVLGPQTQFGITESEFVRFCDDVEFDVFPQSQSDDKCHKIADLIECKLEPKTPAKSMSVVEEILKDFCGSPTESEIEEEKTPNSAPKFLKETKSIVDEILEDFCGSPFSDCSPKANSEDSTPIFRFKEQPIRTYSGLKKRRLLAKRNIASDSNVFTSKDDGNTSDSSSGLSVQEDFSQSVVPQLDTVDLNKSVKLCENLLNLSSYFSQLSSSSSKKDTSPPTVVVDDKKDLRLGAIVDEIIKLKSKPLRINWNKNEREFRGFTDFENDSHESTLQELLEDEDDVLQLINCDSLCYEKVEPKNSLAHVESDLEKTLKNASAMIENAKALLLSDIGVNQQPQDLMNKSKLNCDNYEEIQNKESPTASFKDEQLFDEIDIWNDNECLLNYKTQKPHPIHEENDLFDNHVDNNKFHRYEQQYEQITDPCSSVSLNLLKNSNQFSRIPSREQFRTKERNITECKREEKEDFTANDVVQNEGDSNDKSFNKLSACNFQGFATASRKPIAISDTAKKKADEFLRKFEQQDLEQRIEVTETDFSKESSTPTKEPVLQPLDVVPKLDQISRNPLGNKQTYDLPPSNSTPNSLSNNNGYLGFSTASKKPISISSKAKQKADNILKKFEQDEQEKRMLETETTSQNVDNKKQEEESVSLNKVEDNLKVSNFVGFSTASEKPIAISLEAKRKADEILKKFEQVEKIEEETNERLTQRHPNEVSEEVRRKAQELLLDIEFFEEAFEDELKEIEAVPVSQVHTEKHYSQIDEVSSSVKVPAQPTNKQIFNGFQTASKKSIHISEEARRRAENFLKEVYDEDLPQEFLKCIETENNEANYVNKNPVRNSIGIVEQVDGALTSPRHHHHDVLNKDAEHMHVTNGSEIKNEEIDHRQFDSAFKRLHEQNEDCFKDKRSHSEEYDHIQNIKSRKRKHSEGLELDKSFSLITTPRRLSCGERTPLNRIENGLLAKSSSLPSKEYNPKSALISRKNLLSLNKRKKSDSPGQRLESIAGPKTPEKVQQLSNIHNAASSTPNLKGFFDLVSTSTPRLVRNETTNRTNQNRSKDTIDSDFRKIQWEDSNNSFRINRTGCADELNVTFSEVSPSPKQRIEVLKMYGEPPPISPILMLNKCRPSGLRRGRSLMKP
ncbi:breast cancer type 2 susceptibility protein homolog [Episyrphus balteatus]|uniref:breast cancer type 2 susceptibility protein homolog n=1 Tax=Episyrphus balteatus TaxID=286459 RepID=UPI002485F267|nr:breast cancer type 2 susceptibility protein homolog [Episyrphus balteatus]